MGFLTKKDSTLFRTFFKEMSMLRGIPVAYRYVTNKTMTIHGETVPVMSRAIPIDIIFEENPKIATLQKIGWISERPDDKPYIAYLPFDVQSLTSESTVSIPPIDSVGVARNFKVTTINTLLEFPDAYICTLAPIFTTDASKPVYDESNYNYLDSEDTPQNNLPGDSNYEFLNVGDDS